MKIQDISKEGGGDDSSEAPSSKCVVLIILNTIDEKNTLNPEINLLHQFDAQKVPINPIWPGGGTLCPPCYVFAYICANTRTSLLKKT